MTDYIKRDIERVIANAQECDIDALTWEEQKERLKAVKSADVVPVVRCKDCKYSRKDELWHMRWCKGVTVKDEHFCADGERKDDDGQR